MNRALIRTHFQSDEVEPTMIYESVSEMKFLKIWKEMTSMWVDRDDGNERCQKYRLVIMFCCCEPHKS